MSINLYEKYFICGGRGMITEIAYDRERAVEYARRWALSRNPLFVDFTEFGGNCTNFVSQCIYAGAPIMNYTETFGWYYISGEERAPAWSGVDELYNFLVGEMGFRGEDSLAGPYGVRAVMPSQVQIGDVVQLSNDTGDYYHSLLISKIENGEIYICANSNDALDKPLSEYTYAKARFIHIRGVRYDTRYIVECFDSLYSPPLPPVPETENSTNIQNNQE